MKWRNVSLCHLLTAFLSILTHNSQRGYVDAWLSAETLRLKPWTFFQTIGQGPALPAVSHTKLEFINGAPCPVSIDRQSFFMVDLKYGEVCSMKAFILFINENGYSSVSKMSFDFTDFLYWYITGERWNIIFIYTVTFSYNFSLLIRVSAPDAYLSVLRQPKHSLVKRYGDILLSLLFCEQIILIIHIKQSFLFPQRKISRCSGKLALTHPPPPPPPKEREDQRPDTRDGGKLA